MGLYFLIGLLFGASLGLAVGGIEPVRHLSGKKKVGFSILFVEVLSLPLLVAGSLALKMSAASAGLWFSISFFMHLVFGLVLGIVLCLGLRTDKIKKPEAHDKGTSYGKATTE